MRSWWCVLEQCWRVFNLVVLPQELDEPSWRQRRNFSILYWIVIVVYFFMLLYILYTFMCCTSCMHVYVLLNTVCATRSCEAGWCLMYMVIVLLLRMSCSQILLCLVENCYKLFQDQKKWLSLGDAQHRHDHPVHSLHLGLYNYLRRNFWNWFRKKKCIFVHHLHLNLCNYLRRDCWNWFWKKKKIIWFGQCHQKSRCLPLHETKSVLLVTYG